MSKKKFVVVFVIILLLSLFSIESFTKFFGTKTVTLHVTKKSYFVFDLVVALDNVALGPGETTLVEPKVVNDSTENMYVFVKVSNPKYDGERLYLYDVNDSWILVDDTSDEAEVYAYASSDSEMTVITPGEETIPLASEFTMREISYPEYSRVEDPSLSFQVFALGIDDMPIEPTEVWNMTKELFLLDANI